MTTLTPTKISPIEKCIVRAFRDEATLFMGSDERLEITSPNGKSVVVNANKLWKECLGAESQITVGWLWGSIALNKHKTKTSVEGKSVRFNLTHDEMKFFLANAL